MDKILEILKKNNLTNCDITPIGHHQLDRNYVYWIKGDEEYILKVYQKEIKYLCEKRGLKTFEANPMIPQMIDYGEKEFFWILSKKIKGYILEEIWPDLNLHLQKKTVELLGELLGGIHKKKKDTYFGGWVDMPQRPIFYDFIEYRKQNDHRILTRIKNQSLPDQELFNKAFDTLKNYYKYLNPQSISSITHRDFSYRNMLVEKNNNQIILKGLIDFEHCQMDDPCIDFNPLYQYNMLYNKELEEIFFKTYKKKYEFTGRL
ncbi:MAG: aminoglycoside phosphotransferase family protein [Clostridia bacterium]|nr:aminoglycoside phosphotransferase family protein [Clostridia bacterium]